jgi:radical SAM superfamily enzyme YgiQ (UPF0313 family)
MLNGSIGGYLEQILLINPGHQGIYKRSYKNKKIRRDPPPMSVLAVGTALKQEGHKVDILDTAIDDNWPATLNSMLKTKYNRIGISVIIGQPMANAREIMALIRKRSKSPITMGGIMPTVMPDEMRDEYKPDEIYPGQKGKLSAIDWTLLGDKCNKQQQPYYQMIMTSRGCPFSCSFCYKQEICGSGVEYRTAEDVCAELDWLYENRGINVFTFGDDNFLTKPSRAIAILNHCRERGYYIEECIGHINNLTDPVIDAMAGLVQTFIFSIETVNPYLQELLRKRIRLHEVKGKMAKLASVGIVCNVTFMIGLPGETSSDLRLNRMFMGDLREVNPYLRGNCYIWLPLPKTMLTDYAEQTYGVNLHFPVKDYENANFWARPADPHGHYFRPHLSEKEYNALVKEAIKFNEDPEEGFPRSKQFYILDDILKGIKPSLGVPLV